MKKGLGILLLLLAIGWLQAYAHPYYVSTAEIHIHPEKKSFDISCSIFTEDLEAAMKSLYLTNTDLQKELDAEQMLRLIYQYMNERLELWIGGEKQTYALVGCENQEETTWCYLEGTCSTTYGKVSVIDSVLFESQTNQTNMVHVYWDDERQSTKLVNPQKQAEFYF